jgi:hypothetical protein
MLALSVTCASRFVATPAIYPVVQSIYTAQAMIFSPYPSNGVTIDSCKNEEKTCVYVCVCVRARA